MSRFLIGINSAKCGNNAAYFSLLLRLNRTSQAIIRRQNIYFTLCGSRGCGETPPQITFSFLHVRSTLPPAIYCCYLLYWSTIQFLSHQHWQRFVTEVRFPSVCEAVMAESKARFHKCSYFARLFFFWMVGIEKQNRSVNEQLHNPSKIFIGLNYSLSSDSYSFTSILWGNTSIWSNYI